MKKVNIICTILMLVAYVGLALLKLTHMPVHIGLSVFVGVVLLVLTILSAKTWKYKQLEVSYRVMFLISLVTGIALINVQGAPLALVIVHIATSALFVLGLIVTEIILPLVQKKN